MNAFIVPWQADLVSALAEFLLARNIPGETDFSETSVVFPHRRPRRHLLQRLSLDQRFGKPLLPPGIFSSAALLQQTLLSLESDQPPRVLLPPLDQALLLQETLVALQDQTGQAAELPTDEIRQFLPWGLRLAKLLEDLYRENRPATDLYSMAGDVRPFAALLLENLGRIESLYRDLLDSRGLTTPGYDLYRLARRAGDASDLLQDGIILAGFEKFTGAEEAVYAPLLQSGRATLFLHADPRLATDPKEAHWSCHGLSALLAGMNLEPRLWDPEGMASRPLARPRFHEGYDLHSQLDVLARELHTPAGDQDTLVALPDSGLLMPVLHHLQGLDVNAGMGYPLARSPLARLLESILRLQETRQDLESGARTYSWREVIGLVRHPYLKMLEQDGEPLRPVFRRLEQLIRKGESRLDPRLLLSLLKKDEDVPDQLLAFAKKVLDACLTGFEELDSPGSLAHALNSLCALLIQGQDDLWRRFPLDAECLHRLLHQVMPSLRNSIYKDRNIGTEALFQSLRQLIEDERAPFESETTGGVQVLGLLETRALRFSRVIILDVTEQNFPGAPSMDPLLPDSLRFLTGLPGSREQEQAAAYRFFRLLWGADETVLLTRQGGQDSGLLEARASRSRFIEELLFEEEMAQGRIFTPSDSPIRPISYTLQGIRRLRRSITKTPKVRNALEGLLDREITVSMVDDYLRCPAQFFYQHIAGLKEEAAVLEEGDPLALGTLVHDVFQEFFKDMLGQQIGRDTLDARGLTVERLHRIFSAKLKASPLNSLPVHQRMGLDMSCRSMLRAYLENFPGETTIVRLETKAVAEIHGLGRTYRIKGRLDRVDLREEGLVILDYKTGSVPYLKNIWEDGEIWDRLGSWEPPGSDPELLALVASKLPVAQLPCYLHLALENWGEAAWNAGLIELRDKGTEKWLWGKKLDADSRDAALREQIPLLLRFLLTHLDQAPEFTPMPGRRCDWCAYSGLCAG